MPYTPTWNNPYTTAPYGQPQNVQPTVQYPVAYQPTNGVEKVSGKDSLWQLPMGPNSTSKPYFDFNGKVFYIVTTDAAGAKTIEAFDYSPHVEEQPIQIDGAQFVSRSEYDQFVAKVSAALEAINGVHAAVPATGTTDAAQSANGAAPLDDARGPIGAHL